MIKEFEIKSLTTKVVKTKDGDKEVWVVNEKGDAWKGKWNADWEIGKTVKADVIDDGKYVSLKCPPELRPSFNNPKNDEILENTQKILKILEANKPYGERSDFIPPPSQPEAVDTDIKKEDIPF